MPRTGFFFFFIAILAAVRVWILYCQFLMDIMEGEENLQEVRSTFDKAIIAAGLHVTEVKCGQYTYYSSFIFVT